MGERTKNSQDREPRRRLRLWLLIVGPLLAVGFVGLIFGPRILEELEIRKDLRALREAGRAWNEEKLREAIWKLGQRGEAVLPRVAREACRSSGDEFLALGGAVEYILMWNVRRIVDGHPPAPAVANPAPPQKEIRVLIDRLEGRPIEVVIVLCAAAYGARDKDPEKYGWMYREIVSPEVFLRSASPVMNKAGLGYCLSRAPEKYVRIFAIYALPDDAKTVDILAQRLERESSPKVRAAIIGKIGDIYDARVPEILLKALDDESEEVRRAAVRSFCKGQIFCERPDERNRRRLAGVLLDIAKDEDMNLQHEAAESLGRLGGAEATEALVKLLVSGPHYVPGYTAAEALRKSGASKDPALAARIIAAIEKEKDSDIRSTIAMALPEPGASPEISRMLLARARKLAKAGKGREAVPLLQYSGGPEALDMLLGIINKETASRSEEDALEVARERLHGGWIDTYASLNVEAILERAVREETPAIKSALLDTLQPEREEKLDLGEHFDVVAGIMIETPSANVRYSAAVLLAGTWDRRAIGLLRAAAERATPTEFVSLCFEKWNGREAILRSLGDLLRHTSPNEEEKQRLTASMRKMSECRYAAVILARMGEPEGRKRLVEMFREELKKPRRDPYEDADLWMLDLFGELKVKEAVEPLLAALEDPRTPWPDYNRENYTVLKTLAEIGDRRAVPPLRKSALAMREDPAPDVRARELVLAVLARLGEEDALAELIEHTESRNYFVRAVASWRLAELIGDERLSGKALEVLAGRLREDPNPWIRREIIQELGERRAPGIGEALFRAATSDPNVPVRVSAMEALCLLAGREKIYNEDELRQWWTSGGREAVRKALEEQAPEKNE